MEENNREKKQTATKTVGGKKRKRIITDDNKLSAWSDLPYEILELIKKLLFFIDQVNFRVVCKSWSCIERVPPLQQIPWLLVFDNVDSHSYSSNKKTHWNSSGKEKDIVDSCKLVDPKNNKTYTIDANVIKAKLRIANFKAMKVHESKYGWLLISSYISNDQHDGSRLFLYSPFFSEGYNFIELPVLNFKIFWATFTSNPLDKDCTILTLNTDYYDNTTFLIYTYGGRGDQGSWSSQNFPGNSTIQNFYSWCKYQNWMHSEGNFYFARSTGDCTMGKFDMILGEWSVFPVLPLIALAESRGLAGLIRMAQQSISSLHHYIVKSSDGSELFLISDSNMKHVCWDYDYYSGQTNQHRWGYHNSPHIHRLNLSSMIWEDLDSIGDHVLFIGDGYNSVLNSSVLKSNGEQIDISDKIYYCKDDNLKYCSVHDYTHKTKTENYYSNGKLYQEKNCSRHYGPIATKSCRKMFIDPPPR